jgi:CHAT domain-containing protein/Tfp pilus assembly protein PilF
MPQSHFFQLKSLLFFFCIGISVLGSIAQNPQRDSILAIGLIKEADAQVQILRAENINRAIQKADSAIFILERLGGPLHNGISFALATKGTALLKLGKYSQAITVWSRCLYIDSTQLGPEARKVGLHWNNLAYSYREYGELDTALPLFAKAVSILKKSSETNLLELASVIENWGIALVMRGNHKEGAERFEEALLLKSSSKPLDSLSLAMTYNNLGGVYFETGELKRAREYFQKSLFFRQQIGAKGKGFVPQSLGNLGLVSLEEEDIFGAVELQQQAYRLRNENREANRFPLGITANNLGEALFKNNDPQAALTHHHLARSHFFAMIQKWEHPYIANVLTNIGNDHEALGRFDSAMYYFNRALELRLFLFGKVNGRVALSYNEIAECFLVQNSPALALVQINLAMEANGVSANDLKNVRDWPTLIRSFRIAAKAHHVFCLQSNFSPELALKNLDLIRFGVKALTILERRGFFFSAQKSWQKDLYGFIEYALATYCLLYKRDKAPILIQEAFALSERAKSSSLYQWIQATEGMQSTKIPPQVLVQEQALKSNISYFEARLNRLYEQGRSSLDTAVLNASNRRNDLYAILDQLQAEWIPQASSPTFPTPLSLSDVQKLLTRKNTGLLEFFVGADQIFMFLIRADAPPLFFVVKNNFDLVGKVTQIQLAMRKESLTTSIPTYAQAAADVYGALLKDIETILPFNLIVVPDGPLHLLPFELLLSAFPTDLGTLQDFPYYLRLHCISYTSSAAILQQSKALPVALSAFSRILAMAPFAAASVTHDQSNPLGELKGSVLEVQAIRSLFPHAYTLIGPLAKKDSFLNLAPAFQIIHIATHADANFESRAAPKLYFGSFSNEEEERRSTLYLPEIHNIKLNADLLVLSACETNQGRILRGEGLISLARIFYAVGAKSIVASLWKINDPLTVQIIRDFYVELNRDQYKDEALRKAKLNYLQTGPPGLRHHPYYWAALVPSGDMRPLK